MTPVVDAGRSMPPSMTTPKPASRANPMSRRLTSGFCRQNDSHSATVGRVLKGRMRWWRAALCGGALVAAVLVGSGCNSSSAGDPSGRLQVVAAENFWGSIAQQLGGDRVQVTSLITNPATDPHDYEPTPADGRAM